MKFIVAIFMVLAALALAACSGAAPTPAPAAEPAAPTTADYAPMVGAFYNGGEIRFVHTEVSDADLAQTLTSMMDGPQVVHVPELAEAPSSLLANMYAFTNGIEGHGPFFFQPDIFDSVPGDKAYRPLRAINTVAWNDGADPRELRSMDELRAAEAAGELTITPTGIVANMSVLVWPDGSR